MDDIEFVKHIIPKLDRIRISDNFIIRHAFRNPPEGEGMGLHGVASEALIEAYREGLEAIYRQMTSSLFNRLPPIPEKVEVFVLNVSAPYTYADSPDGDMRNSIPHIVLPSGTDKSFTKEELRYATIIAAHEGAHALNFRYHPPFYPETGFQNPRFKNWEWVDEGIAVDSEMRVLPGSREHYPYLRRWMGEPEVPLNYEGGLVSYRAVMFIRFLDKLLKRRFSDQLWTNSKLDENPISAIKRLLPKDYRFLSEEHTDRDIFGLFCLDSYFLADPRSRCYDPKLRERFGERSITNSFLVHPNKPYGTTGNLDHLACRYYKIVPQDGVREVRVRLEANHISPSKKSPLRAQLAEVVGGAKRGKHTRLLPETNSSGHVRLQGEIALSEAGGNNPLVLVVSNHGVAPKGEEAHSKDGYSPNKEYDDDQKFTIEIVAA